MRTSRAKVAVIGAGFIGTHVAAGLVAADINTVVITRSPLGRRKAERVAGAEVVIADASVRALVEPHLAAVDHVVYCAAGLMPAESNLDPVTDVALALPPLINALEAIRGRPVGLTFLSSGGTVYGYAGAGSIPETHPTNPVTAYGIMKLASEKYVLMYSRLYGNPVGILRCANVYGEHQPGNRSQGVIAAFLDRIARGEPVTLYGDGEVVRDYVHVDDVVWMVLRSLNAEMPAVVNVGSGTGVSLNELIALVADVTTLPIEIDRRPGRGFDVPRVVLDISSARGCGLSPLGMRDGLARTWEAMS